MVIKLVIIIVILCVVIPIVTDDETLEDKEESEEEEEEEEALIIKNRDIYPFVNKSAPRLDEQLTVGGLNKKLAERHWRVLHRLSNDKVDGKC